MELIERYIPAAQFTELHSVEVDASPDAIIEAAAAYRTESDPFLQRMIGLRELPMRLGRRVGGMAVKERKPFGIDDFVLLERDDRELVFGLAGRFWRPDFDLIRIEDGRHFIELREPGIAKLALNFTVQSHASGMALLSTQTRVSCVDRSAKIRFTPYWYLVRPVSGLIRRRILSTIRDRCQSDRAQATQV